MNQNQNSALRRLMWVPAFLSLIVLIGCSTTTSEDRTDTTIKKDTTSKRQARSRSKGMYFPTRSPVLKVTRDGPSEVTAEADYPYSLTVKNVSNVPVHEIVIKEYVQGNLQIVDQKGVSGMIDTEKDSNAHGWPIGTLQPKESKTVKLTGRAPDSGEIQSCVSVEYRSAVCSMINVVKPDLRFSRKIVDADGNKVRKVYACDDVYAVYTVRNIGSGSSETVRIGEKFGNGISAEGTSSLPLTSDAIKAGERYEKRVKLNFTASGTYEGRATSGSGGVTSRSESARLTVMKPSLSVNVEGPEKMWIDRDVTHRITVKNTSDDPTVNTYVRLNLPTSVKRVSTSLNGEMDGKNRVEIGRLEAGESRQFNVSFRPTKPTDLTTSVTAGAYCTQKKSAQVNTQIKGIPAIGMEVVDTDDPVKIGDKTTYLINIKNQGSAPDKNVRLVGKLPKGGELINATGETEVSVKNGNLVFEIPGTLEPGEEFAWKVNVRAKEVGSAYFTLEMTSSANSRAVTEEESTNFVD